MPEDPYFAQYVFDYTSKTNKLICYVVSGLSGQNINILTIYNDNIQIRGKLKDDNFMQAIEIRTRETIIHVTTVAIYLDRKHFKFWNINMNEKYKIQNFEFTIVKSSIIIKFYGKLQFGVYISRQRRKNSPKIYLNINVNTRHLNKEILGGFIGDVGRKRFDFHQTLENSFKKLISVNGSLKIGELTKRSDKSCILLAVKDLIFPKPYSYYVSSR